jgi:DNA-binding winged helix-turn-helix (wHTH) protein
MLAALVAQPGEIVSREALQRAVCGAETHVDFERGLNFCAAQIPSALGDTARTPRYIAHAGRKEGRTHARSLRLNTTTRRHDGTTRTAEQRARETSESRAAVIAES